MAKELENILHPGEVELYVRSLEPSLIEELGTLRGSFCVTDVYQHILVHTDHDATDFNFGIVSESLRVMAQLNHNSITVFTWFDKHERLQKLHQQSIVEAGALREELVKEAFVSHSKVPVLVHEVYCVFVWRQKVFPFLLQIELPIQNSFMPYMVMYHEVTSIAMIETIVFHQDGCEALDDVCIDLIDYCAFAVINLASIKDTLKSDIKNSISRPVSEELKIQQKELAYDIGMRSISILSYIAQALDRLPLYAVTRMFKTHDIPMMFMNLIDTKPWERVNSEGDTLKYIEGRWKRLEGEQRIALTKNEAQTWLCLRHLLLDAKCFDYYEFSDFCKAKLLKLKGKLHDALIDQLSPLIELKQWLNHISLANVPPSNKCPIIVEVVPQIKKNIISVNKGKWKQIIKRHIQIFSSSNKDEMMEVAHRLKSTFDIDTLDALAGESKTCFGCGDPASKRCSRCKSYWFCGRECQVQNWGSHKPICDKIFKALTTVNE